MPVVSTTLNPATYSPVAAPIWYATNSASSGTLDFKYLFTITKEDIVSGTTSNLGTYKEPPRPTTGIGLFTPHRILRSSMSYNFTPFATQSVAATSSITGFRITNGFSYNPNIPFIDITTYFGSNAFIGIFYAPNPPYDIVAGDTIFIELDNPTVNPQYAGQATVVSVTTIVGYQYVEINKAYVAGSIPESGSITQQQRVNGGTSSKFWAYNGTRQYDQINTNFHNDYVVVGNSSPTNPPLKQYLTYYKPATASNPPVALTNDYDYIPVFEENYYTLSYLADPTNWPLGLSYNIRYEFYDADKNYINATGYLFDETLRRYDIPAGPKNLKNAGLYWTASTPSYYSVNIFRPGKGTARYVATKWFKLVPNCSPYKKNWRLAFLNRLGGFDYFNFNWKWQNTLTTGKEEWRQTLPYNYTIGTRGDNILGQKVSETFIVSSDWITQNDYEFLKELITTPEAYLVDETNGQFYPIIIGTTNWQVKTTIDNKLFCASVEFRRAYDTNIYNQ